MNKSAIRIVIPGKTVGKERARSSGKRHYTPDKTLYWEEATRIYAAAAMRGKPLLTGPVSITVIDCRMIPKSWPEWKKNAALSGFILPTTTPDTSNTLKTAEDAFNGIVWVDDSQVCDTRIIKIYKEKPAMEITVWPMGAYPAQIKKRSEMEKQL